MSKQFSLAHRSGAISVTSGRCTDDICHPIGLCPGEWRVIMKKKTTKYRTVKGFDNKMKAEKFLASLNDSDQYSLYERTWFERDKRRYYVRQLVRKGVKK